MPPITFNGEPQQAPVGMEMFEPGETREVSEEDAERLLNNANFSRAGQGDEGARRAQASGAAARAPSAVPQEG